MVPRQREKKSKRSGSGFVRVVTFFCIFLLWFPRVSYSVRVPVADTSLHILRMALLQWTAAQKLDARFRGALHL